LPPAREYATSTTPHRGDQSTMRASAIVSHQAVRERGGVRYDDGSTQARRGTGLRTGAADALPLHDRERRRGGDGQCVECSFDTIDHGHLREILRRRVLDGVLRRLIDKWLNAGVLEDGNITYPNSGSPQGGVISPILANIYLHEVLDTWFARDVKPRLKGKATLVRYADDATFLFEREQDALRVLDVLPKRFGKYGLTLHPEKTRIVDFRRPLFRALFARRNASWRPGTFDLLGFTHFWGKSSTGKTWTVRRSTAKGRFRRALRGVSEWCREHRHDDLHVQQQGLAQKLRGHFEYFGIPGNAKRLHRFLRYVQHAWRKWLSRRSQRAYIEWAQMHRLLKRYPLPQPRVSLSTPRAVNP